MINAILIFIATGVIGFIAKVSYNFCKRKRDEKKEREERHQLEHDEFKKLIKELKPMLEHHVKEHECLNENDRILKDNAMIRTREAIVNTYYVGKENGSLERYKLELVTELYESYKTLGGNSYVTKLMDEIDNGTFNL